MIKTKKRIIMFVHSFIYLFFHLICNFLRHLLSVSSCVRIKVRRAMAGVFIRDVGAGRGNIAVLCDGTTRILDI